MWHLFDRYKGVVWPKARQMNLIAKILNNLCAGDGIKLTTPSVPSPAAPVTIAVDTEWLDNYMGGSGGGVVGGAAGGMFAWTPPAAGETLGTMGPGGCMVGRNWVWATGTGRKAIGESYYLKVTLGQAPSAEVVTNSEPADGTVSYIPIYTIDLDGRVKTDLRGAFVVPAWE